MEDIYGITDARIAALGLSKDGDILGGVDFLSNMVAQLRQAENAPVPTVAPSGKLSYLDMSLKEILDRLVKDDDKAKVIAEVFFRRFRFLRGWYTVNQVSEQYLNNPVQSSLYSRVLRGETKTMYDKTSLEDEAPDAPICVWSLSRGVYEIDPTLTSDGVRLFHYHVYSLTKDEAVKPAMLRTADFEEVKAAANVSLYLEDCGANKDAFLLALYKHGSRVEPALCAIEMVQLCHRHNALVEECSSIEQVQALNSQLRRRWVKQAAIDIQTQKQADAKAEAKKKLEQTRNEAARRKEEPVEKETVLVIEESTDEEELGGDVEEAVSENVVDTSTPVGLLDLDEESVVENNVDTLLPDELSDLTLEALKADDAIERLNQKITSTWLAQLVSDENYENASAATENPGGAKTKWLLAAIEALLRLKPVTAAHLYRLIYGNTTLRKSMLNTSVKKRLFSGQRKVLLDGKLTEPFEIKKVSNYKTAFQKDGKKLVFLVGDEDRDEYVISLWFYNPDVEGEPGISFETQKFKFSQTFAGNPKEHLLGMFYTERENLPVFNNSTSYDAIKQLLESNQNDVSTCVDLDTIFTKSVFDNANAYLVEGNTLQEILNVYTTIEPGNVVWSKRTESKGTNQVYKKVNNSSLEPLKKDETFTGNNGETYKLLAQGTTSDVPCIQLVVEDGGDTSVSDEEQATDADLKGQVEGGGVAGQSVKDVTDNSDEEDVGSEAGSGGEEQSEEVVIAEGTNIEEPEQTDGSSLEQESEAEVPGGSNEAIGAASGGTAGALDNTNKDKIRERLTTKNIPKLIEYIKAKVPKAEDRTEVLWKNGNGSAKVKREELVTFLLDNGFTLNDIN
ncbi:MAG: hypothetical protein ACPGR8_01140 [Limisphaerales bacterium]